MATWRRKALKLFPELKYTLNSHETIYQLFFDLLPMVIEAHQLSDEVTLRKIYGFAEWCLHQPTKDIGNAAGVAFYEHLFDNARYWDKVIPWLSPFVIHNCRSLWQLMLKPDEFAEVEKRLSNQKSFRYNENVYHTSEIVDL